MGGSTESGAELEALRSYLNGEGEPPPPEDAESWARGLERWGVEACVRGALALGIVAFDQLVGGEAEYATAKAIRASEDWILAPTAANARACAAAVERADDLAMQVFEEEPEVYVRVVLTRVATRLASQAEGPDATPGEDVAYAVKTALQGCLPSAAEVRLAITSALMPWADGSDDPVRARVEARR